MIHRLANLFHAIGTWLDELDARMTARAARAAELPADTITDRIYRGHDGLYHVAELPAAAPRRRGHLQPAVSGPEGQSAALAFWGQPITRTDRRRRQPGRHRLGNDHAWAGVSA